MSWLFWFTSHVSKIQSLRIKKKTFMMPLCGIVRRLPSNQWCSAEFQKPLSLLDALFQLCLSLMLRPLRPYPNRRIDVQKCESRFFLLCKNHKTKKLTLDFPFVFVAIAMFGKKGRLNFTPEVFALCGYDISIYPFAT